MRRDTIAAIATAPGRAAIGVIRLSGSGLVAVGESLTGRVLRPRQATLVPFRDENGEAIDRGMALYFPAPRSYTGEDVLELHGHGGPVVLRRLLQRCVELGARLAEPGEFTQRAFLNGKLDLVQAEAVIDLIDASTTQAARGAMRSLEGDFSAKIQELTAGLIELRALVEAGLDFPEEEIDVLEQTQARQRLDGVRRTLNSIIEAARLGSLLREGLHIVFAGEPNVGKSSLLNRFAGEDLAIVTDIPGTTRDPIRQSIDLGGVPAHIVDTAGLREAADPVERVGVERAWAAIGRADIVVLLKDATRSTPDDEPTLRRLPDVPRIRVMNKIDLTEREPACEELQDETVVWLSAKTGAGVDLLRGALLAKAGWPGAGEALFVARERHLRALAKAKTHLANAEQQGAVELFAEELRLAHEALLSVTGAFTANDLLGEIFGRFCIGK